MLKTLGLQALKANLRPPGQSQRVIVPSDYDYAFASLLSAFAN